MSIGGPKAHVPLGMTGGGTLIPRWVEGPCNTPRNDRIDAPLLETHVSATTVDASQNKNFRLNCIIRGAQAPLTSPMLRL